MFEKINAGELHQPSLEEIDSHSGREIEGLRVKLERFKELTLGEDVDVVEINPYMHALDAEPDFCFIAPSIGEKELSIEPPHWRSVHTGSDHSIWDDGKSGQPFFAQDVKGVGYLKPSAKDLDFEAYKSWFIEDVQGDHGREKALGLSSKDDFFEKNKSIIDKSNLLLSEGLRTEAYWMIGQIKRLPFQGEMKDVSELKRGGVLPLRKTWQPYQAIRFLKARNRIEEFVKDPSRAHRLFKTAIETLNLENEFYNKEERLDADNMDDQKKFFVDFASKLGCNIAVLMNLGYSHYRMHSSNITLAAEVVDLGTISPWNSENDDRFTSMYDGVNRGNIKDIRDLATDMKMLRISALNYGINPGISEDWVDSFMVGYENMANDNRIRSKGNDPEGVRRWLQKIMEYTLIKNRTLPGLLKGNIEDWDIG